MSDRIVHFACGHVIPDENILPAVVTKGPTGKTFDFSFQFRSQPETLDELGRALVRKFDPRLVLVFYFRQRSVPVIQTPQVLWVGGCWS